MNVKLLLKLLFVVGLLWFLSKKGFVSLEQTGAALSQWQHILPAFLFLAIGGVLAILRWYLLISAQGFRISFIRVFQLGFIGNFFNIALPGAVSGDLVKAVYVAREAGKKKAHSLSGILFDRVAGLSGLFILSLVSLFFSFSYPWSDRLKGAVMLLAVGGGTFVVTFYLYLFTVKEKVDPLLKILNYLGKKFSFLGAFSRLYLGVRVFHNQKRTVLLTLLMSVVMHSLVVLASWKFSLALGEDHLPFLGFFVLAPLGLLVTAVPITPAGVGTGHAAFLAFFHLLGSQRGADIFSLLFFYQLLQGALGGLIYLRFKSQDKSYDWHAIGEASS